MFFVAFLIIFSLIHFFFYKRFILKIEQFSSLRKYLLIFVIINFLGIVAYMSSRYYISIPPSIYFFLSLSIGVGFAMFLTVLFYEAIEFIAKRTFYKGKRRDFFKKSADVVASFFGIGYIADGVYNGTKEPELNFISVEQNLFGKTYKIVQISDMHIGGLIDFEFVKKSVQRINELDADLVAITGDLIDTKIANVKPAINALKDIKSKYGTFYVAGNHEYFHGIVEVVKYLKSIGIRVLENESVDLGDFCIVGVYDLIGARFDYFPPDVKKAFSNVTKPTLFLAHQPKQIEELDGYKPNLTLSGHTHGGQIAPFNILVSFNQPFVKGLHKFDTNSYIYVNSGIGFWGPPMRVGSTSEITIISWS